MCQHFVGARSAYDFVKKCHLDMKETFHQATVTVTPK